MFSNQEFEDYLSQKKNEFNSLKPPTTNTLQKGTNGTKIDKEKEAAKLKVKKQILELKQQNKQPIAESQLLINKLKIQLLELDLQELNGEDVDPDFREMIQVDIQMRELDDIEEENSNKMQQQIENMHIKSDQKKSIQKSQTKPKADSPEKQQKSSQLSNIPINNSQKMEIEQQGQQDSDDEEQNQQLQKPQQNTKNDKKPQQNQEEEELEKNKTKLSRLVKQSEKEANQKNMGDKRKFSELEEEDQVQKSNKAKENSDEEEQVQISKSKSTKNTQKNQNLSKNNQNDTNQEKENKDSTDTDEDNYYTVEKILERRKRNGIFEYYVKWIGYNTPTWEPYYNLDNVQYMVDEFVQQLEKGQNKGKSTTTTNSSRKTANKSSYAQPVKKVKTQQNSTPDYQDDDENETNKNKQDNTKSKVVEQKPKSIEGNLKDGDVPLKIIGARVDEEGVKVCVEWKRRENDFQPSDSFVSNKEIKQQYPLLLIEFYESKINQKNTKSK